MNTNIIEHKSNIKTLTRNAAFNDQIKVQLSHSKVLDINMKLFETNNILQEVCFQMHQKLSDATLRNSTN